MLDAAKIAEELRYEQENAQTLERERKEMEIRAHDLQVQLDDAEQASLLSGCFPRGNQGTGLGVSLT